MMTRRLSTPRPQSFHYSRLRMRYPCAQGTEVIAYSSKALDKIFRLTAYFNAAEDRIRNGKAS